MVFHCSEVVDIVEQIRQQHAMRYVGNKHWEKTIENILWLWLWSCKQTYNIMLWLDIHHTTTTTTTATKPIKYLWHFLISQAFVLYSKSFRSPGNEDLKLGEVFEEMFRDYIRKKHP